MTEPARKPYDSDNEKPVTKPDLRALEGGGETTEEKKGHLKSADSEMSAESKDNFEQASSSSEEKKEKSLVTEPDHENRVGGGYKPTSKRSSFVSRLTTPRALVGLGALGTATIVGLVMLFSFLNIFKLDGLMSNIDSKSFLRSGSAHDKMSSKMFREYIRVRLAEVEDLDKSPGDRDNILITAYRANRVDMNNPFFDWYRTMRVSKFEDNLLKRHGIKFVSISEPGKLRKAGIVQIKNVEIPFELDNELRGAIDTGDWVAINTKFKDFVDFKVFDQRSDYRVALNSALDDLTRRDQVMKRRHLRKYMTNMLGYRSWVFFGDTRDKSAQKQVDIRNRVVSYMIPDNIAIGRTVKCAFGLEKCRTSSDAADPDNRSESFKRGVPVPKLSPDTDSFLNKVLKAAGVYALIFNMTETLNMITDAHFAISKLEKLIVVARGTQAMGMYQVFETSRDQIKSGEVNSGEVNQLMQVLGNAGGSEGWTKVVEGRGDPSVLTKTEAAKKYCSNSTQADISKNPRNYDNQFTYLCPNTQIGSADRAETIQDKYNGSLGVIVGPLAEKWQGIRSSWIGKIFTGILGFFSDLISAVMSEVLAVLGLKDDLEQFVRWIFGRFAEFLGAGPIVNGQEPAGVYMNWVVQGGAYSAESASRFQGAALTNDESRAAAMSTVAQSRAEESQAMSWSDKLFSLENNSSVAYKARFEFSNLATEPSATIASWANRSWTGLWNNLGGVFGQRRATAQSVTGYESSSFAAIESFDFPPICYTRDGVTAPARGGTNIVRILSQNGISITEDELTWEITNNTDVFYEFLYQKIGTRDNGDDIAKLVYNCNLLDNAIRGSLGYIYDYTKDNGLEDSAAGGTTPPPTPPGSSGPPVSGSAQDLAAQILANKNIDLSASNFCRYCTEDIRNTANGQPAYGNVRLDLNLLRFLAELGQSNKVDVNAITGAGSGHSSGSNHYSGKAIDFGCSLNVPNADSVGAKYGIKRYAGESCPGDGHWHYSTTGD